MKQNNAILGSLTMQALRKGATRDAVQQMAFGNRKSFRDIPGDDVAAREHAVKWLVDFLGGNLYVLFTRKGIYTYAAGRDPLEAKQYREQEPKNGARPKIVAWSNDLTRHPSVVWRTQTVAYFLCGDLTITAEGRIETMHRRNTQCNPHPDAPHVLVRKDGRYVCQCEGWMPPLARVPASQDVVVDLYSGMITSDKLVPPSDEHPNKALPAVAGLLRLAPLPNPGAWGRQR